MQSFSVVVALVGLLCAGCGRAVVADQRAGDDLAAVKMELDTTKAKLAALPPSPNLGVSFDSIKTFLESPGGGEYVFTPAAEPAGELRWISVLGPGLHQLLSFELMKDEAGNLTRAGYTFITSDANQPVEVIEKAIPLSKQFATRIDPSISEETFGNTFTDCMRLLQSAKAEMGGKSLMWEAGRLEVQFSTVRSGNLMFMHVSLRPRRRAWE